MKKYYIYLALCIFPIIGASQNIQKQTTEGNLMIPDTIKSIIPTARQSLLKNIDVICNTRIGYDSHFDDSNHTLSNFNMNQFRLEIKGKIHDKVAFRFRNKYTRTVDPGSLDNLSESVDFAFLTLDLSSKTQFSFGKLYADWGGYEYDFNPIDILAYNDMNQNSDSFLMGATISHSLTEKHILTFQLLNSRTRTYDEIYGTTAPPSINPTEYPLAAVINWRGKLFKNKIETTWSYSFFNEAKGAHMNFITLGNKFKAKNFILYYDFSYSFEGLDRKGIISRMIFDPVTNPYAAQDVRYMDNWVRAEYLVAPKITMLLSVFNSNHYWKANPDPNGSDKLSTSYGIIPTIEYLPFKNLNMRFFVGYVARKYDFTNYAQNSFGAKDYTTGQLCLGIIAPLLVL